MPIYKSVLLVLSFSFFTSVLAAQQSFTYFPEGEHPILDKHIASDTDYLWLVYKGTLQQYRKSDMALMAVWNESNSPLGGVQAVATGIDNTVYAVGKTLCQYDRETHSWIDSWKRGGARADIAFGTNEGVIPISYETKIPLNLSCTTELEYGHRNIHHGLNGKTYSNWSSGAFQPGANSCNSYKCHYIEVESNYPVCYDTGSKWFTSRFFIDTIGQFWYRDLFNNSVLPIINRYESVAGFYEPIDTMLIDGATDVVDLIALDRENRFWIASGGNLFGRFKNQSKNYGALPEYKVLVGDQDEQLFAINAGLDSLMKFDGTSWSYFPIFQYDVTTPYELEYLAASSDRFWFYRDQELFYFKDKTLTPVPGPVSFSKPIWTFSPYDDELWMQFFNDKLFLVKDGTWIDYTFNDLEIDFFQEVGDQLWVVFETDGAFQTAQFVNEDWVFYADDLVYNSAIDSVANIGNLYQLEYASDTVFKIMDNDTSIFIRPEISQYYGCSFAEKTTNGNGLWAFFQPTCADWWNAYPMIVYYFDGTNWSEKIDLGNTRALELISVEKNDLRLIAGRNELNYYHFKEGGILVDKFKVHTPKPENSSGSNMLFELEAAKWSATGQVIIKGKAGWYGNNPYNGGRAANSLTFRKNANKLIFNTENESVLNLQEYFVHEDYYWIKENDRLRTNIDFNFGEFISGSFSNACNQSGLFACWLGAGLPESNYTYSWSDGDARPVRIGELDGNFSIESTSSTGLFANNTLDINNNFAFFDFNETIIPNTDTLNGNGAISLDLSGGLAPYEIIWSNDSTTNALQNLAPGDYSVSVTDANGCIYTANYTVADDAISGISNITSNTTIFPNPFSNMLSINSSGVGYESYQVIDLSGRVLHQGPIQQSNETLDLSRLERGVYLLSLQKSGSKGSLLTRIVKL